MRQGVLLGPILSFRSGYSFGLTLAPHYHQGANSGIGPDPALGRASFIAPTKTFSDRLEVTIAGVRLELIHVPSEAPDEVAVYLPRQRILLSGEAIQGPTLPNIHTLRGTRFRDPVLWVDSLDRLRELEAEHLVPAHGQPVSGKERVEEVLRMTRDGIQYVHDQTVRHMNRGLTPDELVEAVHFPPHLESYRPYLREYYGTVAHAVRQIYVGYLGWFEGDPVDLQPTSRSESAHRHVELMGGRDRVLDAAKQAFDTGDRQWAAELATHLIRVDPDDSEARSLKARSFRELAGEQLSINWHYWYLMAADEHTTLGFRFTDLGEEYALEIRRGVAQLHRRIPDSTELVVAMTKSVLDRIRLGDLTLAAAMAAGDIQIPQGTAAEVGRFLQFFEPPLGDPPALTVR